MADQSSARRRFQFRLRTLLLFVTLASVVCWVVVDRQRLIGERDDALRRAIQAEGEAGEELRMTQEVYRQSVHNLSARVRALEKESTSLSPSKQP
jgi:hypothetical protein